MRRKKIIQYNELEAHIAQNPNERVMVGGCFDMLHIGHIRYLQGAKDAGEIVIVALESDMFIEARKHRQAFHTQSERAEILATLSCVDEIVLLPYLKTDDEYEHLVKLVKPAVIAVTEHDPVFDKKQTQAQHVGARVVAVVPVVPERASRDMIATLERMG